MPNITLRRGSVGSPVEQAQRALNYHFAGRLPGIQEDGIFGPNTEARVHEFQRRNGLLPTDGIIGPITRGKLFAIGIARIRFSFKKVKNAEAFGLQPNFGLQPSFRLQPSRVGDGPPTPPSTQLVVVDWGQTFAFQPFAKLDEEEHLLTTDLRLALKNNGEDQSIIGLLKIDLPPGQPILPNWQLKAELERPVTELKILGPLEANVFTTQAVQLSPFQVSAGVGVKLGVKILGDKINLIAQGDVKMQYTPEERKGEVTPSASGAIEFKF